MKLPWPLGRIVAPVTARLRDWGFEGNEPGDRNEPLSLRIPPPEATIAAVPAAYMPLYLYLDRRYAATVVLTFDQIELLLGFAPAFADADWWTEPCVANDRHTAAWTAARRSAAPRVKARVVAFERLP